MAFAFAIALDWDGCLWESVASVVLDNEHFALCKYTI